MAQTKLRQEQVDVQGGGSGENISFSVTQTAHGFDVLDTIYHDGTEWVLAQADDQDTLGTHIVIEDTDANNFIACQSGRVEISSHGLTPGSYYFVSDSVAGGLTTTEPEIYSNPIVYVEDSDFIHVLPWRASATGNPHSDGWSDITTIPTRQSADDPTYVLRFAADMTGVLSPGMRIKITQSTVKYFIVTAVGSYTSGNTDITVYGGTDYDVADTSSTAITAVWFSMLKSPFGFPLSPLKWTLTSGYFSGTQSSPSAGVFYNTGGGNIVLHIGSWNVTANFRVFRYRGSSTGSETIYATVSTANNSESDITFTLESRTRDAGGSGEQRFSGQGSITKTIDKTSKATHYANIATSGTPTDLTFAGSIQAVCAYL